MLASELAPQYGCKAEPLGGVTLHYRMDQAHLHVELRGSGQGGLLPCALLRGASSLPFASILLCQLVDLRF